MRRSAALFALLLAASPLAHAGPAGSLAEAEAGAYRIHVDRVSLAETRVLEGPERATTVQRSCMLSLRIEAATPGDMQAIAGVLPGVRATDDTGLRIGTRGPAIPGVSTAAGPRTSRQTVVLEAPDRRATRLAMLEGTIVLYRTVTAARAEFDLTPDRGEQTEALGDARITVQKVEISGDECVVRLRIEAEPGLFITDRAGSPQYAVPALITRSGAQHRTGRFRTIEGISPEGVAYTEQKLSFTGLKEPPARLVYDALLKSEPDRRVTFRLVDVPLPGDGSPASPAPARGRNGTGQPGPAAMRATGAFAAADGGGLSSRVLIGDAPAGRGRIALGLSREEAGGWSAVRWIDVPAEAGIARLTGLKPGRYRIRRAFTPAGAAAPLAGAWKNAEVVAVIAAGRETALPPLQKPEK